MENTKQQIKRQMKFIFYMSLGVLTGSVGLVMFAIDQNINLNTRLIGIMFVVSCIGHMVSFWENMKR